MIKTRTFQVLLVAVVSILVYSNSLDNSFHYDDAFTIVDNVLIRDIGNIPQFFIKGITSTPDKFGKLLYRPLTMTTYALNYSVGKLNHHSDIRLPAV